MKLVCSDLQLPGQMAAEQHQRVFPPGDPGHVRGMRLWMDCALMRPKTCRCCHSLAAAADVPCSPIVPWVAAG